VNTTNIVRAVPVRNAVTVAAMAVVLSICTSGAVALAQTVTPVSPEVAAFTAAARQYVDMHRRLEQLVGPITLNSSVESINRSMQALATAIRAERPDAKQGDLFTPALGRELRALVGGALLEHGFSATAVRTNELLAGIDPTTVHLRVNGTFPWGLGVSMFPCVIEALPPLPAELQYRIVGNDLVLIDVHASLIVDILPGILVDMTAMGNLPGLRENPAASSRN
jgi:hypothetical protein